MSLTAAKNDLITQLRTAMNWTGAMVDEYDAYAGLPAVLVYSEGEGLSEDFAGDIRKWRLIAEMRTHLEDVTAVEYHRDPSNADGLAGALNRIRFDGTLVAIETEAGVEFEDEDEGGRAEYLWVKCEGDLYTVSDSSGETPPGLSSVYPSTLSVEWLNNLTPGSISGSGRSSSDPYSYSEQVGGVDTSLSFDPDQFFQIGGAGSVEWVLSGMQRESGAAVSGGAIAILNTAGDRVVVPSGVVDTRSLKDVPLGVVLLATNSADRSQTASFVFWVQVES